MIHLTFIYFFTGHFLTTALDIVVHGKQCKPFSFSSWKHKHATSYISEPVSFVFSTIVKDELLFVGLSREWSLSYFI